MKANVARIRATRERLVEGCRRLARGAGAFRRTSRRALERVAPTPEIESHMPRATAAIAELFDKLPDWVEAFPITSRTETLRL